MHAHRPGRLFGCLLVVALALGLGGCAGNNARLDTFDKGRGYGANDTFPVPDEIRDNVEFWRHVYGVWSRADVAIHDDRYMDIIYEVVRLPEPIQAGYTPAQKALIASRKAHHQGRVQALQQRVRDGRPLDAEDRALLDSFKQAGGVGALAGADERVRSQRGLRERFKRGVEISGRYDAEFREIMSRYGVPEDLAYLPHVESSFQTNARSSVGAGGVWQFMPATGRIYMTVNGTVDERFDPILAADGAARYLSEAHDRLGSWPLAVTSYNHGQGGMAKAKAIHGDDIGAIVERYQGPYFGFASRNFYSEFIAAREVASNAERYFPEGLAYEEPWTHDRLVLRHPMPAHHVASHYGVAGHQLADLNLHWQHRARAGVAQLPAGSTVWLPAGSLKRVASHPSPAAPAVAKAAPAPRKLAIAKSQPAVARSTSSSVRYHVVKPKETLYRVAVQNGLTVSELRKLNAMGPQDTVIRPGQKLKVPTS
ncbi:transglycosylase SLT domain-containing protein [Thiohalocapsa marina]|uniref:Transglycosylase SLT domain-containing protein n=1 Tax=Thiohalocapsa marina TaxID=424902 RepID=A0A5M8FP94_9GAMM|nr:lytic transglycosylase domain-containing protein [Thiohalocapsa marina]KAA6186718.1 transglycosylase SLT domain-containing protein [Thiohalocapsa marina]